MIWKKMAHLAEIHTLHTLTSERRTDRRRRRSLTRTDYEFDDLVFGYRFLRHCVCGRELEWGSSDARPGGAFAEEVERDETERRNDVAGSPTV
jgi:hypothetical protein